MPKSSHIQTNFTAGELSPKLFGRVDVSKYANGAAEVLNFLITPFGGAQRTPGTRFVGEVRDSDDAVRLIPFQFSTEQAYILELNDGKIRFYRNKGRIVETAVTITDVTQADPGVVTATAHGYSDGDDVVISDVVGMTRLNGRVFRVANKTANTFELTDPQSGTDIDTTEFDAYASGGESAKIYEISHPWADADLSMLQWAQTADVMYIVHEDYEPRKLSRTGHTSWTLTKLDPEDFGNGPYLPINLTATTLNPSATSGAITIAASSATGINGGDGFKSTDVDRLVRLHDGYAKITAVTNSTNVDATVIATLSVSTATADWELGAWSGTTGFPSTVTFFEQRLALAASTSEPQTVWLSVSESIEDFEAGSATDDALVYTIASDQVNRIRWLWPSKVLFLGTSGGVFSLSSGSDETPLSPTNVVVKRDTTYGASSVVPKQIGEKTIYVQRDLLKVRELGFSIELDNRRAIDATILADHITKSGIAEIEYQQSPYNIIWALLNDGSLATFTREIDQEVAGWSKQSQSVAESTESFLLDSEGTLPTGLVAYYKLGESSGVRSDSKGSNDLTDNNTVGSASGKNGSAANFVAANSEYLSIADNADLSVGDTIGCWVYLDSKTNTSGFVVKYNSATNSIEYALDYEPSADRFRFLVSSDGIATKTVLADNLGSPSTGQWYFIRAWHDPDADTINIQVDNGTVDSESHSGGIKDGTATFSIGAYADQSTGFMDGRIDEVGIWKKVLSSQEASDLYNQGSGNTYIPASSGDGFVAIAVIPATTETEGDQVWVIVSRIINGLVSQYIEYFELMDWGDDEEDAFFVRSGLTYDGASASTITGLDHLEGEEVMVYGDGETQGPFIVEDGSISLITAVEKAQVGLQYISRIKTLRIEAGSALGTAQGQFKRINNVIARVLNTKQIKIGDANTQYDQNLDSLTTDDVEAHHDGGWDTAGQVVIRVDDPVPAHILSVIQQLTVQDR